MKKFRCALILVVVLLFPVIADAQLMSSAWAKYMHDIKNTGLSQYSSTSDGTVKWGFQNYSSYGFAIDSNNILYYIEGSRLIAVYSSNGSLKWKSGTDIASGSTYNIPAISSDGIIYLGDGGKITAFYSSNGTVKWTTVTSGAGTIETNAAIDSNGTIYFGADDFSMYAFHPNGTQKWVTSVGNVVRGSPAIDESVNAVYFGSDNKQLYALYLNNGSTKWTYNFGAGSPRGGVAIGTDGTIYSTEENIGAGSNGCICAIWPNGTTRWYYYVSSSSTTPAIGNNGKVVYFVVGADIKAYYANNGTLVYNYAASNTQITTNPIIDANEIMYIVTPNPNRIYGANPDGSTKWYYDDIGTPITPSIDTNGVVYTQLYAFASQAQPSTVTITCPIGWCYAGSNYSSTTLLALDNLFSNDTVQGRYNATSQKYESHRTSYSFNQNVTVAQKEGYYYYFTSATDITTTPGSTTSITLKTGWSLVANYGSSARTLSALKTSIGASATQAKYYDKSLKTWVSSDSQSVPAMEAFFVYVTSDTIWGD